jgi:hypothetical protein
MVSVLERLHCLHDTFRGGNKTILDRRGKRPVQRTHGIEEKRARRAKIGRKKEEDEERKEGEK